MWASGGTQLSDILIVEDEPSILSSLEFILKHAGFAISSVTDGETALAYIRANKPKAIVLDVMLPKRSGFEVLKDIRGSTTTSHIPVLILTAKGQQQDMQTAMDLGATAFVTKPYANSDVVNAVKNMVETGHLSTSQS